MANIAELQTKLTIDNKEFKRGLQESANATESFSRKAKLGFAAAGAIIAGGLVAAVSALSSVMSQAEERVSKLVDTSTRLGVGIPQLQRLQYAAQQSGIGIDSINSALGKLSRNIGSAVSGNKQAAESFARIGLNAQQLVNMGVDQQYIAISEAIKSLKTPAEQAAAAVAIFGRGGLQQLSLLKDNVSGLVDEFKGLGIELTSNQAKSLEAYGDSASKLGTVWEGFKNQLAAALAGPFKHVLDWIIESSIKMGGLGSVAQYVAKAILSTASNLIGFFGAIYRGVQTTIIAVEELLVLLLRLSQIGTLGLSNIDLPFGLGNAGNKIQSLKQDINTRSANFVGSQQSQQRIQVEIQAASGFVATVVNSPQNKSAIETTVNNQLGSVASGGR